MKQLTLILAVVVAFGLIACSSSDTAATDEPAQNTESAAETAMDEGHGANDQVSLMEVGCAACVYSKEGITACTPAVKVGEKTMVMTGMNIDAHALGMCSGPKQAKMAGHAHGETFHVTAFELQ